MKPPTNKEILNEELGDPLERESDDSWRHGCIITEVYKRAEDSTYWQVQYQISTDRETNGLRDGDVDILQVVPYEVTATRYKLA